MSEFEGAFDIGFIAVVLDCREGDDKACGGGVRRIWERTRSKSGSAVVVPKTVLLSENIAGLGRQRTF